MLDAGRIVTAVWDGDLPQSPEAALQVAVSRLRSRLGNDLIETATGGYTLGEASVDVALFDRKVGVAKRELATGHHQTGAEVLRSALSIWRGVALTGCDDVEFVRAATRTLDERRMSAVEELIDAELSCGRHEAVVGELFGLVDEFPYRERLWGQLMLALYRSGRQAEALSTFGRLKSRLGEDLGLEPGPAVVELEGRIVSGDPALVATTRRTGSPSGGARIRMQQGEVVFREGDAADAVYWIVEGLVEVFSESTPHDPIAQLGPGRYFGELGPLLGLPRSASVRVVEDAVLEMMTVEGFRGRFGAT